MGEFLMPSLGADMERGTIVEWLVAPGDRVHRGDTVAVVSTEKSDIEVEVFEDGAVGEILVEVGEEVPVGTPLATIVAAGDAAPAAAPPESPPATPPPATPPPATPPPETGPPHPEAPAHPRTYSPLVRHLADERGLDLDAVEGTGVGGTVTRADVERAVPPTERALPPAPADPAPSGAPGHARPQPRAPEPGPTPSGAPGHDGPQPRAPERPARSPGARVAASPLSRRLAAERGIDLGEVAGTGPDGAVVAADLDVSTRPPPPAAAPPPRADRTAANRAALAEQMARSKREIPHYYLATTIDLEPATTWLAETNADRPVRERLLLVALLLKATALAATTHTSINGHWVDGQHRHADTVHLGVAINLRGGGLVAPALADAQDATVDELMARLGDLVARARAGTLRGSDLTEPTLTVTNLGDQGVDSVFGVITPPQVALVGFGRVSEQPWADRHMLAVRPVVTATLSGDHRASTGHEGARFLNAIARHLEHPEQL
jgi:pyruvate dehydrogenase E2 component (dihydrolipoamide acetyltransferase)